MKTIIIDGIKYELVQLPSPSTKDDNTFQVDNGNSKTNMPKEESKTEKPILFTTEDGVGIREGECYWMVGLTDWGVSKSAAAWYGSGKYSERKYFSTEQAANDYILMNKPLLSVQDIISFPFGFTTWMAEEIKKVAKNKSNNSILK